jgi:F-type H+-transporting ATPase subunit b
LKNLFRSHAAILLFALLAMPGARLFAQASDSPRAAAAASTARAEEPDAGTETEQYRHSSVVQAIARFAHLSTEATAQIIEDLNSGVLIVAIAFALWKFLPKLFRTRTETLQKDLIAARLATEEANRKLAEVEARLLRLDSEIGSIRQQVEQESIEDEKRIHATLEAERERVIASAEQEIAAVQAAAQRDLKKFAADLAIDHAMRRIQLSNDTDRALVREFGKSLKNSGGEA